LPSTGGRSRSFALPHGQAEGPARAHLYQRTGNQAAQGPPGETGEAIEDWLWPNVDLTYFSGCGLVAKGSRRFWRRHGHADHTTIRTLHSDVSLQDLGVVLGRAEAFLAGL